MSIRLNQMSFLASQGDTLRQNLYIQIIPNGEAGSIVKRFHYLQMNQDLFDFPMSQLFRDALDPNVQEIVEAERLSAHAQDTLRRAEDALEEVLAQGARQRLHSWGYYAGRYFPENRLADATRGLKPKPTKPSPTPINDELKRF